MEVFSLKRAQRFCLILFFFAGLLIPLLLIPPSANATSTYTVSNTPVPRTGNGQTLGTVKITISNDEAIKAGDLVEVHLPMNVTIPSAGSIVLESPSGESTIPRDAITVTMFEKSTFRITIARSIAQSSGSSNLYLSLKDITLTDVKSEIQCLFVAPPKSCFSNGSVVVGRLEGSNSSSTSGTADGVVTPMIKTIQPVEQKTGQKIDPIMLQINKSGNIPEGTIITLRLPAGYEWDLSTASLSGYWDFADLGSSTWSLAGDKTAGAQVTFKRSLALVSGTGRIQLQNERINVPGSVAGGTDVECTVDITDSTKKETLIIAHVNVGKEEKSLESITISPRSLSLNAGKQSGLSVKQSPESAGLPAIQWSSSDETIATVSANGTVTGIKSGTAVITAKATDALRDTCTVVVSDIDKPAVSTESRIAVFFINRSDSTINGIKNTLDAPPVIQRQTGRTLAPLRSFSEAIGAKVGWDSAARTILITDGSKTITLTVDSRQVVVNGQTQTMDNPPQILSGGRTYVPLRFISETMGASVVYDPSEKKITVTK